MKNQIFIIALLLGVFYSIPTFAETVEWQSTAMACIPTSTTAEQNRYITTAGRVKFKPGKSGLIAFMCPVSRPLPTGKYKIRGRIKTESKTPLNLNDIGISLRSAHNVTGAVKTVLRANNVENANGNKFRFDDSLTKKIKFDFRNFTYWVSLSYRRKTGNSRELSILSVQLIRK